MKSYRRLLGGVLGSVLAGCATGANVDTRHRLSVKGLIAVDEAEGAMFLTDCDSETRFQLGDVSRGSYLHTRQVVRSASREHAAVTAEVSGYPRRQGEGYVLEWPAVLWVEGGKCADPVERSLDYD